MKKPKIGDVVLIYNPIPGYEEYKGLIGKIRNTTSQHKKIYYHIRFHYTERTDVFFIHEFKKLTPEEAMLEML